MAVASRRRRFRVCAGGGGGRESNLPAAHSAAYAPGMNPTLIAAAIGVGGTVIVGLAGFSASVWNTRKTAASAHESRVWDEQAKVYVDAVAAVYYRQAKRDRDTATSQDARGEQISQAYLATYEPPSWIELDSRLLAFGSEPVVKAMQAAFAAHLTALGAFESWHDSGGTAASVDAARDAANEADDAVVELIRAALQGKGQSLGDRRTWPGT